MTIDIGHLWAWAQAALTFSYAHAPFVTIALTAFLLVPLLATAGYVLARPERPAPDPVIMRERAESDALADVSSRPVKIRVDGTERDITVRRRPVRIGRKPDNDVRLFDTTVHGYHAVVARDHDGLSVIDDVSGPSGNGLKINGRPARHAVLQAGDVIELGKVRLTVVAAGPGLLDGIDDTDEIATREHAA